MTAALGVHITLEAVGKSCAELGCLQASIILILTMSYKSRGLKKDTQTEEFITDAFITRCSL